MRIVAPIEKGDAMDESDRIESAYDESPACDSVAQADYDGATSTPEASSPPADTQDRPPAHDACHNKDLGARGEEAACAFLLRRGFDILERNWVCAAGEADIIALEEDTLHFIEVKTRMSDARGFPAEAVDRAKRERYERIAELYLRALEDGDDVCVTFDVISILVTGEHRAFLRFHRNVLAGDCRSCS